MSFAHAWVLALLPVVALAFGAWSWGVHRGRARAAAVARESPPAPRYAAAAGLAIAAALMVVAAAQPRWGKHESLIPRSGAELVVVLDVSRSMGATDVPPSRIEAAKAAITATLSRLGGDRVGLVIFAGNAHLRLPLTTDLDAAGRVVSSLETGPVLVDGGTNAATGLDVALQAFDSTNNAGRLMLFLSDGDDLQGDAATEAQHVRSSGIDLIVAGTGTAAGGTVPIYDADAKSIVAKAGADGQPIVSHLNETFLRALSTAAGGRYLGTDLSLVPGAVEGRLASLQRAQFDRQAATLPVERFQWFAGAALLFLLLGAFAGHLPRPGRRQLAALATALLGGLLLTGCATRAHDLNEQGRDALRAGQPDRAIALFQQAQSEEPQDARLSLNLAAAFDAAGRYDEASLAARRALTSRSPDVRAEAYASIGHHRFAQHDLSGALDAFRSALLENPGDATDRHDYEVVLRLIQDQQPHPGDQQSPGPPTPTPPSSATPAAPPTQAPAGGNAPANEGGNQQGGKQGGPQQQQNQGGQAQSGGNQQGGSSSPGEVEQRISDLDAQVAHLLHDAGDNPTTAQALQILQLLAQRAEIAGQRDALAGGGDPNDY